MGEDVDFHGLQNLSDDEDLIYLTKNAQVPAFADLESQYPPMEDVKANNFFQRA